MLVTSEPTFDYKPVWLGLDPKRLTGPVMVTRYTLPSVKTKMRLKQGYSIDSIDCTKCNKKLLDLFNDNPFSLWLVSQVFYMHEGESATILDLCAYCYIDFQSLLDKHKLSYQIKGA